ncbi:hypothetical protein ACRAWF_02515 [Streptomyces sp. L7]
MVEAVGPGVTPGRRRVTRCCCPSAPAAGAAPASTVIPATATRSSRAISAAPGPTARAVHRVDGTSRWAGASSASPPPSRPPRRPWTSEASYR